MFRILIGIIIFTACAFCGIRIRRMFSQKEAFFKDLSAFCLYLREQISFTKTPVPQIAKAYQPMCAKEFSAILMGLEKGVQQYEYPKYVKVQLKGELDAFFQRLGKSDLESQLRLIDENKKKIDIMYDGAKIDKKKKGELGYKLSLLAGIALLIIVA